MREAREKKGLSQEQVAEAAGVSQNTVSRWERDGVRDMHAESLRGVLRLLDVSEAYLRGKSSETKPATVTIPDETPGTPGENNADRMVMIEKSLARAFDHDRHTLRDLDDVRAVLREAPYLPADLDTDRAAAVWLDACARLRTAGQRVTGAGLAVAMMALPRTHTTIPSAPAHTSSPPAMESTGIKVARKRA